MPRKWPSLPEGALPLTLPVPPTRLPVGADALRRYRTPPTRDTTVLPRDRGAGEG